MRRVRVSNFFRDFSVNHAIGKIAPNIPQVNPCETDGARVCRRFIIAVTFMKSVTAHAVSRRLFLLLLFAATGQSATANASSASIPAAANLIYALEALNAEFKRVAPDVHVTA